MIQLQGVWGKRGLSLLPACQIKLFQTNIMPLATSAGAMGDSFAPLRVI